jgi:hypothetical protein
MGRGSEERDLLWGRRGLCLSKGQANIHWYTGKGYQMIELINKESGVEGEITPSERVVSSEGCPLEAHEYCLLL